MSAITFGMLWQNHPSPGIDPNHPNNRPCEGGPMNQCAARMGVALRNSGADMSGYTARKCSAHNTHITDVHMMVQWLRRVSWLPQSEYDPNPTLAKYNVRRGIIAMISVRSPDGAFNHIDVWNGHSMGKGKNFWITNARWVQFWDMDRSLRPRDRPWANMPPAGGRYP